MSDKFDRARFAIAAVAFLASMVPLATRAADMTKVLHVAILAAETGFDPVRVSDSYSATIAEQIYEPLLTYDYLARPAKLVPLTADAMPRITDNGKTWLIRLKSGILFQPDPAFRGQTRELTVNDYVYTFMRLMDPKVRSPWQFLIEKKIADLDDVAQRGKASGAFD